MNIGGGISIGGSIQFDIALTAPTSIDVLVVAGGGGGAPYSGGGGGGFQYYNPYYPSGGTGGSGIVVIRYADTYSAAVSTTNLAAGYPVVSGGYRVYKWNSSGSITF